LKKLRPAGDELGSPPPRSFFLLIPSPGALRFHLLPSNQAAGFCELALTLFPKVLSVLSQFRKASKFLLGHVFLSVGCSHRSLSNSALVFAESRPRHFLIQRFRFLLFREVSVSSIHRHLHSSTFMPFQLRAMIDLQSKLAFSLN
jgi:hypothetical protein